MRKPTNAQRVIGLYRGTVAAMMTAAVFSIAGAVGAQETPVAEPTPGPTPTPVPTPIPAAEISDQAAATAVMLRESIQAVQIGDELEDIAKDFEAERLHLDTLAEETSRRMRMDGPATILEETEKAWNRAEGRIDGWQATLKAHAEDIDTVLATIAEQRATWQLTLTSADAVELPPEVRQEIVATLRSIDETEQSVRAARDAVLKQQARISKSKTRVGDMLAAQQAEILRRRRSIVGFDSPALWKAFSVPGVDGGPSEQISVMWTKNAQSVREYALEDGSKIIRHLFIVILIVIGLVMLRRRAAVWAQQDQSLDRTVRILDRPYSAALIITILLGGLLHPGAPSAWLDVLSLVLLIALLRLFPLLVPKTLRPLGYVLAALFFLEQASRLAPDGNLIDRLLLLTLSVTAAVSCWWTDRRLADRHLIESDNWRRAVRLANRIALTAFVVGSIANIIGSVGFATLVIEGTLTGVFLAILMWVAVVLLRAVVRVVLLTQTAKKFDIVRLHAGIVRVTVFKFITWGAVLAWAVWTLEDFNVLDQVTGWLGKALDTEISFGEFVWTPGAVLLFVFMIWFSFKVSQLIRFGLETDVLPRMDLPRGVPGAISKITHYVVIVVGFTVAAVAAGLDFSRVNLIIGALGVGIGFGLQNVVNNFVSGLILLFERPVRVGDRVQVEQLSGVVTDIGMRASIVRTWQGAEVIVPNANLISSEVINWTLSDENHRIEIPVGVAYGTDPQAVIDLLVAVAAAHPEVSTDPEPFALFLGFGESSLDFELRAWTGPDYVRVASDLRVAVHQALVTAGVEIPFPQRDLHLRSVDRDVPESFSKLDRNQRGNPPE